MRRGTRGWALACAALVAACGSSGGSDTGADASVDDGGGDFADAAAPAADGASDVAIDVKGDAPVDAPPDAPTRRAATWSKMFGDGSTIEPTAVAADAQGNIVLVGWFQGTVDFGGGPLTAPVASNDIFVAKLDPAGKHLWSKKLGDTASQLAFGVAIDSKGAIVITGNFASALDFGGGVTLTSAGAEDVFVAKLDATGAPLWAHAYGDAQSQSGFAVAIEPGTDAVAIAGYFQGAMNVGGVALTSAGDQDVFVAKLDASGVVAWARGFGDAARQTATAIAFAPGGGVVVTGGFNGAMSFAAPAPGDAGADAASDAATDASSDASADGGGASSITSAGLYDLFVLRLDGAGAVKWGRAFGDANNQIGDSVAIDAAGNVFVSGGVEGTIDFGDGPHTATAAHAKVLAKLSEAGAATWSKMFGDGSVFEPTCVAVDTSGNVAVTGAFQANVDFGAGPVQSYGGRDVFLAKFSSAGTVLWSTTAGDMNDQVARAVAFDPSGDVLVMGYYDGVIDFGDGPLASPGESGFLAKLAP